MDFCPEIVQKAIDYAFEALGRQVLYVLCYEKNVDDFDDVAQKLQDARKRLQHSIDTARRKGEHIEDDVERWMEKVDKMSEEIQKFKENGDHARAEFSNCRFPHLWCRHQLSRNAKKISEAIVEIQGEQPSGRISYPSVIKCTGSSSIEHSGSRVSLTNEILESLKNPNLKIAGVFGLGGVGKTTLVKEVSRRAEEDKLFTAVVMAVVTQKLEVSKIQTDLAFLLGLEFREETERARALQLRERLKTEKKVLVILDDLWEGLELERVGIPFGDTHKGCQILLISRNKEVLLNQMDCQQTFEVPCLPDDEAWSLFKNMAELADDSNIEIETLPIAEEIAKRCGGLPIAINTVAKALRRKRIAEWREALRQLKGTTSRDITKMVDSCIELSYRHLDKPELKSLFLLAASYGLTEIFVAELLKYSVGLGLLGGTSTIAEARDKLEMLLGKLRASCLLLDDDSIDYIFMHDVVRAVGISIAAKENNLFTMRNDKLNEWPNQDQLQNCTAINLFDSDIICELPKELFCPRLNLFIFSNKDPALRIPDNFFRKVCEIKVIDFTAMKFSSSGLPPSMAHLSNLQSLSLDYCILRDIEVIGDLKTLKVLSFMSSDVTRLPENFRNLSQLQLLDLSDCSKLQDIPGHVVSSWKKLEELLMKNTNIRWEHGSNASLTELNHLSELKTLDINIRDASMPTGELLFEDLMRYRILIGDGLNWSHNGNTVRTLKIKLRRSDRLEQWVRRLFKNVDDLYLDELFRVKNVVCELNEEGFKKLKHIQIRNNRNIQYIVEWFTTFDHVFPILESLVLHNLLSLESICHGRLSHVSFGKLKIIKVTCCHALTNVLSLSMVRRLSQLKEIQVSECNLVEQIFVGEEIGIVEFGPLQSLTIQNLPNLLGFSTDENTREYSKGRNLYSSHVDDGMTMSLFNGKVSFPNLETLELSSIRFQKIWQDGHSASSCVQSLTSLRVDGCIYMKYLFSVPVIRCLMKLKHLKISGCPIMEAIIQLEDVKNIHDSQEAWFSSLETLKLYNMNSLRTVWSERVTANAYPKLKTIEIEKCRKLRNVIPACMLVRLKSLEALIVSDCTSLFELFSVDANSIIKVFDVEGLDIHLQKISVEHCPELKNLFPLSLARGLVQLEALSIQNCGVEEIVRIDTDLQEPVHFVFPRLQYLRMWNLDNFKYFYPGSYTLKWPNLTELHIHISCEVKEDALFVVEEVIPNLKTLALNGKSSAMEWFEQIPNNFLHRLEEFILYGPCEEYITFPQWILQKLPPLQWLLLGNSSFEEGFPCVASATDDEQTQTIRDVKIFQLHCLPKLEVICKEGCCLPMLKNLEAMLVSECSSLVKLVPSSVLFNNMKYLKIKKCNGLKTLITLSTAKSLVHLSVLNITECTMIEEVVVSDGQNEENEIEFRELQVLKLKFLPRLKCFWSMNLALICPKLYQVTVKGCPRMSTFVREVLTTPQLHEVQVDRDGDECYWEGDLNTTIERIFNREVALGGLNRLELQEFPELKEIWHSQLPDRVFCNLRELVVEKCDFLSTVISNNLLLNLKSLEELQVGNCDNVEAVFDLEGNDRTDELKIQESFNLRVITLNHLPRLKQIWKVDPAYFSRFQKLQVVKVTNCPNLDYVFPCTTAEGLLDLEELEIDSCKEMGEIIAKEDGSGDVAVKEFIFPNVTSIRLTKLPKLKNFYKVEWPRLRSIYMLCCDKLAIFTAELESLHEILDLEDQSTETQIPLFSFEKVFPNLEKLSLERRDAMRIWQGQVAADLFGRLNFLLLQSFHDENATFPYWFLEKMHSIKSLVVKYSSFKEIFPSEILDEKVGQAEREGLPRLEEICLWALPRLEYICRGGFQLHPMLEILEKLYVKECPLLTNIVPSSVSFTHLKYLGVWRCHGLKNLMTLTTARSLLQLEAIKIDDCEMVQEIVDISQDEEKPKIELKKLRKLKLKSLPRLERFCLKSCTFVSPNLIKVTVTECPSMKVFSLGTTTTPKLQRVKVGDAGTSYWDGNLNSTIRNLIKDLPESS